MGRDNFDTQVEGQMNLTDVFSPEDRLFAVSRIFARARKDMTLAEQKTFVCALSQLKFTEEAKTNIIYLDKKKLAQIVGVFSDPDHLSVNLFRAIKELPKHSYIEIPREDRDFYESGQIITKCTIFGKRVRIKFEEEYMSLFTGLTSNYITMWSSDIFQMTSTRSIQFYEYLRQITDTRKDVNSVGLGVRAIKEMFDIPKAGKGSYMREKDGLDRANFERFVIDPLCEDLKNCKMINLIIQPNGRYYEKVKNGGRVEGYRFYWTMSEHPAVASATEVKQIQERVDKNPRVLKVAKDILDGEKKPKKNSFTNIIQSDYEDVNEMDLWDN